jgi:class 3 adenylate cyclase
MIEAPDLHVGAVELVFGDQLSVGGGHNSGTVVAGNVGGAGRLEFGVIGDAVNVARASRRPRARPEIRR